MLSDIYLIVKIKLKKFNINFQFYLNLNLEFTDFINHIKINLNEKSYNF